MNNTWSDDVIRAIDSTHHLLQFLKAERSQLYGAVIHLMMLLQMEDFPLPDMETLTEYNRKHYIMFAPKEEGGKFFVTIKNREDVEDKDD